MTVSAFSIVKNEAQILGYGLMSMLDYVDEVVYFDGNSTDGTLKLLDHIKSKYDPHNKIKVFMDKDFSDFKEDYVRVFNECMKACSGDYLFYIHPDMIITDPGDLVNRNRWTSLAYYTNMRSFAGEGLDQEIVKGRTGKWKTIMANKFGLHYDGFYGAPDEDMYFKAITGEVHKVLSDMRGYPFEVKDSGIKIDHYCECKPRVRREQKMETVFKTNTSLAQLDIDEHVINHPRVHLKSGKCQFGDFRFEQRKDALPEVFSKYKQQFDGVLGK